MQNRFEYLSCLMATGRAQGGTAQFEDLSAQATVAIIRQVAIHRPIEVVDGTPLLQMVSKSPLLASDAARVVDALHAKVQEREDSDHGPTTPEAKKNAAPLQTLLHGQNYFGRLDWDKFLHREATVSSRLILIAFKMESIGLWHPAEKTVASMASIALAAGGMDPGPQNLAHVRELKTTLRNRVMRLHGTGKDTGPLISEYPANPNDLKTSHPQWYHRAFGNDEPIECPLNMEKFRLLQGEIPCRSSRSGCNASVPYRRRQSSADQLQPQLCMQMLQMMNAQGMLTLGSGQQPPPEANLLQGFRWCPSRSGSDPPSLCDGAPAPPADDGAKLSAGVGGAPSSAIVVAGAIHDFCFMLLAIF